MIDKLTSVFCLRLIIFVILFSGLFANLSAQSIYSVEVRRVIQVLTSQQTAWNNGDIEGYMRGYWKSDSLLFTSSGNIQRGWQATFEKYKKSYDTKAKMGTLNFSDFEIMPLSPTSAWVFGRWELKRDKDNPKGVFTLILRKFGDDWKIIHDHTSSQK